MNKYDHAVITFSDDEQTMTANGDKFRAVEGVAPGRCTGCSFKSGFGCAAYRSRYDSSFCLPGQRKDGRGIIWVPVRTAAEAEAIRREHEEEYRAGLDSVE